MSNFGSYVKRALIKHCHITIHLIISINFNSFQEVLANIESGQCTIACVCVCVSVIKIENVRSDYCMLSTKKNVGMLYVLFFMCAWVGGCKCGDVNVNNIHTASKIYHLEFSPSAESQSGC